jgi:hypothetical protein
VSWPRGLCVALLVSLLLSVALCPCWGGAGGGGGSSVVGCSRYLSWLSVAISNSGGFRGFLSVRVIRLLGGAVRAGSARASGCFCGAWVVVLVGVAGGRRRALGVPGRARSPARGAASGRVEVVTGGRQGGGGVVLFSPWVCGVSMMLVPLRLFLVPCVRYGGFGCFVAWLLGGLKLSGASGLWWICFTFSSSYWCGLLLFSLA